MRDQRNYAKTKAGAHHALRLQSQANIAILESALRYVADLVIQDDIYAPIFVRLEEEIKLERAAQRTEVVSRARAFLHQKATG